MDRLKKYRQILRKELEYIASIRPANAPEIEGKLIVDKDENQFILTKVGWSKGRYHHGMMFHFEIKNGKIWLHQNHTDIDIGIRLEKLGIPKSDIVLGFVSEIERTLDGYALA